MRIFTSVLLTVAVTASAIAGDGGYKVAYDGGSISDLKPGASIRLYVDSNGVRLTKDNSDLLHVPAAAITEISYGQDVHRRVGAAIGLATVSLGVGALMALTKSKKHF